MFSFSAIPPPSAAPARFARSARPRSLGTRALLVLVALLLCAPPTRAAADSAPAPDASIVTSHATPDGFTLVGPNAEVATLHHDDGEIPGVVRALGDLRDDIRRVTGHAPALASSTAPMPAGPVVLVGTVGHSAVIDELVRSGRLPADALVGKWESHVIATVERPLPGLERALVIAGSDKRGTIYGIYELSRQIGVSPWHFWADVPAARRAELHVKPGVFASGEPKVKYRGIFINDEAPALRGWAEQHYGGFNQAFYAHVFELLLRCRANYLWPAMWLPVAFNADDPGNPRLADHYGIVMGTSHHEPMMRAHHEWERFGGGAWNYETNGEKLREFWRGGIERMGDFESLVTIGMRGDGDEAMSETTAVPLLQKIVRDQRAILSEVRGKPAAEIPQVWALYKEVQDYYEKGMRVDDDIIVLFADDNWGNIRPLPRSEDLGRRGGYGMYYHVDYVGAPVSYRWLNVSQIERIWEQMTLTYEAGVRDLWIVNVGDIKPMELPMSFFLDLAWDPEAIRADDLPGYYLRWAAQQFGEEHAPAIAEMLALYTKYNARRTHEMLAPDTYSIANYREADRVLADYQRLADSARALHERLPAARRPAFFQLVLFPVEASANLLEMYVAAGKNAYYAERGAPSANYYADRVRELFAHDAELTRRFHEDLLDGKWNHMMSQTHIGYTSWAHPPLNRMPAVSYVQPVEKAELGFFLEHGGQPRWGWLDVEADWSFVHDLPVADRVNDQRHYVEVVNRGREPLAYTLTAREDWIRLSRTEGTIRFDEKVFVRIDWEKAPRGRATGTLDLSGAGKTYAIRVPIRNESPTVAGFVENHRVVAIEADAHDRASAAPDARWITVPNLGRTGSGLTIAPSTAASRQPGAASPQLEYTFTLLDAASVALETHVSPTQNFRPGDGIRFAIAIDDEPPRIININEGETVPDWKYAEWWQKSVGDHIKIKRSSHGRLAAGTHTLRVWMIDPGLVIQRFVIDAGGLRPAYLGPPASKRVPLSAASE